MRIALGRSCCVVPLLLVLVGCGGSTPAPSAPSPASNSLTFAPGAYTLSVSRDATSYPGPNGSTFESYVCAGMGSYPTTVQVPVDVQADGGRFRVRAVNGSLQAEIVVQGMAATGTLRGSAGDGAGKFSLVVESADAVSFTGTLTDSRAMSGTLANGAIRLEGPNGAGGCSPMAWSLTAR